MPPAFWLPRSIPAPPLFTSRRYLSRDTYLAPVSLARCGLGPLRCRPRPLSVLTVLRLVPGIGVGPDRNPSTSEELTESCNNDALHACAARLPRDYVEQPPRCAPRSHRRESASQRRHWYSGTGDSWMAEHGQRPCLKLFLAAHTSNRADWIDLLHGCVGSQRQSTCRLFHLRSKVA